MKLSIITINFRKPSLTLSCVAAVYTLYKEKFEKGEWECVIVDNFSEDNSVEILEKEVKKKPYKHVSVVAHKENNGFGGGNNFGVKNAKGDIILFLNNDTIVEKGLDTMLAFFVEHETIGILGGPLKNKNGFMQSSAGQFYSIFRVLLLLLGLQRIGLDKNPKFSSRVDWVKGALLMMRKDLFEKMHGFDEGIFMYTEDMELCYRAKKMGKETWFFPDVVVMHEDQGSSSREFAIVYIYQGILYFYKKHRSQFEYVLVKLLLQIKALLLLSLGKLTKNAYLSSTYEKALNTTR
ncbi:MAG TPA: glycosyltransferase [Patescibacteria group bacterium]|nr:glycosyltransferase [Patescibacteria group bacterium]